MKKKRYLLIFCLFLIVFFPLSCSGRGDKKKPVTPTPAKTVVTLTPKEGDYFPLHVGSTWSYQGTICCNDKTNKIEMVREFKVTDTEEIAGVKNFILESFIKYKTEEKEYKLKQREYFEKTDKALICHSRVSVRKKGSFPLKPNPPEKMMEFPVQAGQKWTWKGDMNDVSGNKITGEINFEVLTYEIVTVPAGSFEAYKIKVEGKMSDGSAIISNRWFSKDVGLVKEESTATQNNLTMYITAELKTYSIQK